jgi:hypothetical protein
MSHHQLEAVLKTIRYPHGIIAAPGDYCAIRGESFFPGGKGHVAEIPPVGGLMYLGHNFDKIDGFLNSVRRGREENLTWRRIRDSVFSHIPAERIWFTNYFMGVLLTESNVGALERSSGFDQFEEDCWNFFKLQVAIQKPRLIVALGREVVRILSPSNRLNIPSWKLGAGQTYGPLRLKSHPIRISSNDPYETQIIAAYHPSFGRSSAQIAAIAQDSKFAASLLNS